MKTVIAATKKAKNMKNPNFKTQSVGMNNSAIANVSLGSNYPNGPHDHANPATKTQMHTTT
ncbi:conserved hypothetical protein [Ricinus communis]|uniref:Uncharacterized protein n=1 Tax=Ricinus communis TaxID=3988 RepID=B9SHQ1_RICCO|nr:conserved hypothetical protein [Ricinus communis]